MNRVFMAPEGKVYDWAVPHVARIIEQDGSTIERVEHLYAKYISLTQIDDIDNYILVDWPVKE